MAKCNTQANDKVRTANNWQTPGASDPGRYTFILGLISSIRLLTARYCHFLLVGQIQPVVTSAHLWSINTLGHFHSVIKYGLLTMAHYGHTARIRPIDDMTRRRPIVSTARRRPIVSTAHRRPTAYMARRRPTAYTARRRPTVSMARRRPSVTTVNISPWLLWPSFKKNCIDYKQTNKQDNKEINKQATYARLSRLLHILHPLGIKVRHQCKYREQSSISYTLVVKVGDQHK